MPRLHPRVILFSAALASAVHAEPLSLLPQPITWSNLADGATRTIQIEEEKWDFSDHLTARITIVNTGTDYCRVEAWLEPEWMRLEGGAHLEPGETRDLVIHLRRNESDLGNVSTLFPGMRGIPGGTLIHWANIDYANDSKRFLIKVYTEQTASIEITDIVAFGDFRSPQEMAAIDDFFPFVDVYGQYKYDDWPGKVHNDADLQQAIIDEEADLLAHPVTAERNEYGGWATGPLLEATGHFRVQKYREKWWFVDPSGRLFWSFGTTGIRVDNSATKTQGREQFFEDLPLRSDPVYGDFVTPWDNNFGGRTYDFGESNLYRKYGTDWRAQAAEVSLRRLKSWGLNTMGNWSASSVYLSPENRTPYTVAVHFSSDRIHSSVDVPDPYSSSFRSRLNSGLNNALRNSKNDAYCIGFFIDNEIHFKENNVDFLIANGYMKQASSAPGKTALINFLKAKHTTISALNTAWGTAYGSWSAVEALSAFPAGGSADALEWESVFADQLFRIYNEEAKKVAPNKLYMGSRFLHDTPIHIINGAAPHVDVVSMNYYYFSPDSIPLPSIDKPLIIGEFHFGAVERGYFYTGLKGVGTQADRAEAYRYYYKDALNHPNIVGAHWFQYRAQAITGRKDGESFQIGMLDIADNPYPELRAAARTVGEFLYAERSALGALFDRDGDSIPDEEEKARGLDPSDPTDGLEDWDLDGDSNQTEYIIGTDLSQPDQNFSVDLRLSDSKLNVIVPSTFVHPGRTYALMSASTLVPEIDWVLVDTSTPEAPIIADLEFEYAPSTETEFLRVEVQMVQPY